MPDVLGASCLGVLGEKLRPGTHIRTHKTPQKQKRTKGDSLGCWHTRSALRWRDERRGESGDVVGGDEGRA